MRNSSNKIFYSALGAAVLLAAVVAANVVCAFLYARHDMTADKLYTLSDNSRKVLAKLDTPVTLRFYYSKSSKDMPLFLKNYARQVEDLLAEYRQAGKGKITVAKFDPQPDSDAEDAAMLDGVSGQQLPSGDKIYLGLAASCLDSTTALPFLSAERESLLEYDITSAIASVARPTKPVIGVMSALPVFGSQAPPMMMGQMDPSRNQPAWVFIDELKKRYEVKDIPLEAKEIAPDVSVLLLIHPCGVSEATEFAIDQFLLRGGKLAAFLDPKSYLAQMAASKSPMSGQQPANTSSDMKQLLQAWGVKFDAAMTIGDLEFGRRIEQPRQLTFLNVLDVTRKGIDKHDILTAQLNKLTLPFAGFFTGEPAAGLKRTVLLKTTKDSAPVAAATCDNPELVFRNFKADPDEYDLAISLVGKFKTAFPDGPPGEKPKDGKTPDFLKESKTPSMVVLVADSDMLSDQAGVQTRNILGQKLVMLINDNLKFGENVVDALGGDSDLIGIRGREAVSRPFERVNEIRAQAERQYKERVVGLEESLRETQRKLNELQRQKTGDQRFIMSPEQERELKNFQAKQNEVRKELKEVRKQLRSNIDSLENRLKWINIALVPALVILFGLGFGIVRKRRSSAR